VAIELGLGETQVEHDTISDSTQDIKREAGIAYVVLRKIHYNVMRFNNAFVITN
jgi:deferrochelatase/peroxidase EfeB